MAIQLQKQGSTSTSVSPVARVKATDAQRAEVLNHIKGMVKDHTPKQYTVDTIDYLLMGAITYEAFVLYELGNKARRDKEAYMTGVRRGKRTGKLQDDKSIQDITPLFGLNGHTWEQASKASEKDLTTWLKACGALS